MEIVPFLGRERNARVVSGEAELLVTLDVGPRILSFGTTGGPNLLFTIAEDEGHQGGEEYRFYGGHRLWIAPEEPVRTMQPDNDPVEYYIEAATHRFVTGPDKNHVSKELRITTLGDERFRVEHLVTNHGPYAVELAAWAPTQMLPGQVVFPQAPFQPHTENLLPTRPLVLWAYTKLGDSRWSWGDRIVRLTQDTAKGPTKVGSFISQGYAAYEGQGSVFVKRWHSPQGNYPDFGCNFETFTNEAMIEIESLGPMVSLPTGGFTSHVEEWRLYPGETLPADDEACAERLAFLAA
ncbi:hypothetical protein EON79_01365 [bacterium]|nr:MAG: hypothetical protein EON79_01365 [bacterium]